MGRPTKYKPEYCKEMDEFFNIEPHFETPCITTHKDGSTKEEVKLIPSDLPLFCAFAIKIGTSTSSMFRWGKKHKKFREALKRAKACQKKILITNGLQGLYSTAFAIFTAKNVIGWRDKQEVETTHKGKVAFNVAKLVNQVKDELSRQSKDNSKSNPEL